MGYLIVLELILKHMYISTGIKIELVRFCVNCNRKGQVRIFHRGAGDEIYEAAGRANGMGLNGIGEVGD